MKAKEVQLSLGLTVPTSYSNKDSSFLPRVYTWAEGKTRKQFLCEHGQVIFHQLMWE